VTGRGRKAEVELVELDGLDDPELDAGTSEPQDEAPAGSPWRRVRRAWPVALLAVVVAGAYLVKGAREQAAAAARHELLAGQEAYVPDLGREPEILWRVDAPGSWVSPVGADDVVLYQPGEGPLDAVAVAVDRTTGAELWRTEHEGGTSVFCGLPRESFAPAAGTVACVEQRFGPEGDTAVLMLQERDVRTGEVRSSRDVPSVGWGVAPWRSDLLRVDSTASGMSLRLEDAQGATVWTLPLLDGAPVPDTWVSLEVWEDRAVVSAGDRALVVEHDGSIVVEVTTAAWGQAAARSVPEGGQPGIFVRPLVEGGYVFYLGSGTYPERLVVDADGQAIYEVTGEPQPIGLDDGSAGQLSAWNVDGGGLDLLHRSTGELVRHLDRWQYGAVYLLDGRAVLGGGGRLRAVDLTTGEDAWSEISGGDLVASDGVVVVVQERNVERSWLRALDLGSGREVWRLDLVSPEAVAFAIDGALYVHDDGQFSRLGR